MSHQGTPDQRRNRIPVALRDRGGRLLLVFIGLLFPLWMLGALIDGLREGEVLSFDLPVLNLLHGIANGMLDHVFAFVSSLGYGKGVLPLDVLVVIALLFWRCYREATFAMVAMVGSLILNAAAKQQFARARPDMWFSIASTDAGYSFPSGHAMASMTLALVLVLLSWNTGWGRRLRWATGLLAGLFVIAVGVSRVYLGLHYPSDILAGWAAAAVWVVAVYAWAFAGDTRPFAHRAIALEVATERVPGAPVRPGRRWVGHCWRHGARHGLPLIAIMILLLHAGDYHYLLGDKWHDDLWQLMCVVLAGIGMAIRIHVVGHATDETGKRRPAFEAGGLYSFVRHPLYLGNFLIFLGIVAFLHDPWPGVICLLGFCVYYERLMLAEEGRAQARFGRRYVAWAKRTPLVLPRTCRAWRRPAGRFRLRQALNQEINVALGVVLAMFLLDAVSDSAAQTRLTAGPWWSLALGSAVLVWCVLWIFRKATA